MNLRQLDFGFQKLLSCPSNIFGVLFSGFYFISLGLDYNLYQRQLHQILFLRCFFLQLCRLFYLFFLLLSYFIGIAFSFKVLKDKDGPQPDFRTQIELLGSTMKEMIFNYQLILRAVAIAILSGFAIGLGLICLILPGIWLAISFSLSYYILIEHHEELPSNILDSMRLSKNIINKNWCNWFLLMIVLSLMSIFIIPIPISILVLCIAVRETVGFKQSM